MMMISNFFYGGGRTAGLRQSSQLQYPAQQQSYGGYQSSLGGSYMNPSASQASSGWGFGNWMSPVQNFFSQSFGGFANFGQSVRNNVSSVAKSVGGLASGASAKPAAVAQSVAQPAAKPVVNTVPQTAVLPAKPLVTNSVQQQPVTQANPVVAATTIAPTKAVTSTTPVKIVDPPPKVTVTQAVKQAATDMATGAKDAVKTIADVVTDHTASAGAVTGSMLFSAGVCTFLAGSVAAGAGVVAGQQYLNGGTDKAAA